MSLSTDQIESIKGLLGEVLGNVSPDELILIDDSVTAKTTEESFDSALGFGVGPEVLLVLPALLPALKEFATTALKDLGKRWGTDMANWIHDDRGGKPPASAFQQLTDTVRSRLQRRGFSAQETSEITDCLIATLADKPDLLRRLAKR
jgi:hypothetical protein